MSVHYDAHGVTLHHGDCLDILATLPDASVDAVVTDPPYGLEFMGKEWDKFRVDDPGTDRHRGERAGAHGEIAAANPTNPAAGIVSYGGGKRPSTNRCTGCGKRDQFRNAHDCDPAARWVKVSLDPYAAPPSMLAFQEWARLWAAECLRVLKPGGHLLAFGGTRTWHRLACAIEDAGFEIRDSIAWMYGSGFPKSLDVSKAIDKAAGATRERGRLLRADAPKGHSFAGATYGEGGDARVALYEEPPATPDATRWAGWGTALKPAHEPIVVARKPLAGTVAANVLAHGTGALNVDGCRIEATGRPLIVSASESSTGIYGDGLNGSANGGTTNTGRWPANVVLDESQAAALDAQSGESSSAAGSVTYSQPRSAATSATVDNGGDRRTVQAVGFGDSGGASRFLYVAKADADERPRVAGAAHPTVKPIALMRWLVRLVTPPGGVVLEPFAGSGTTAEACLLEGFRCIAVEREADYLPLIVARITRQRDPVAHVQLVGDDHPTLFDEEQLA